MTHFKPLTPDTAPETSKPMLAQIMGKYGFVPNLMGAVAASPAALKGMLGLYAVLNETLLSSVEQQVVALTASRLNHCAYCMAAHSTMSEKNGIDGEIIRSLRIGEPLSDPKLRKLSEFTVKIVNQRGHLSDECVEEFLSAGYTEAHVLEVILIVALKTFTNYANHIMHTPVDPAFSAYAWDGTADAGESCASAKCCA